MGMDFLLVAVGILLAFAVLDLMVGVSNDAVNFLNSSIGSRVAPRKVIMIIASLGILAGVLFSSGMMEVARKGIFHPALFTMPELLTIFLAVMITDVLLLDLFNTFGLPTSTTVSIVFELLGAAVAVSLLKIGELSAGAAPALAELSTYINTSKALLIISGILLSVAVAFISGALVMFVTRLIFTFDYQKKMKRYGALWSGIAMASITFFILVKGAKGASFISAETAAAIKANGWLIMVGIFAVSAAIFHWLQLKGSNILKPVILIGTFALALAFAANDLVNFIGVPMAGLHAYQAAEATAEPLTASMAALGKKVPSETYLLLLAGLIMVVTLWISRKARTVTETEINLGNQEEGMERFESSFLSRGIVRMVVFFNEVFSGILPGRVKAGLASRLDTGKYKAVTTGNNRPAFDLLRASVNLMVASAVVSFATSKKLPLSTTYVTFMVAMGTSFSDQAWGRESAVYRVTGVLTVIGGWFMTALLAFSVSALFALTIWYTNAAGVILLLVLAAYIIWRSHHKHRSRAQATAEQAVFNLAKVHDWKGTIKVTFSHMGQLLTEIRGSMDRTLEALFNNNPHGLGKERRTVKQIQRWTNIISANTFKAMRLLTQEVSDVPPLKYAQTIRRLQKLSDGHRDLVNRVVEHVGNFHSGLLPEQVDELQRVHAKLQEILKETEASLERGTDVNYRSVMKKDKELRTLAAELNPIQNARIQDQTSKTRLSILYYAVIGNAMMLSKQNVQLLKVFAESFGEVEVTPDEDPE